MDASTTTSGRVVVGFDGSEPGRAALAWGVAEARLRSAPLDVWVVLDTLPAGRPETGDLAPLVEQLERDLDEAGAGRASLHVGHGGTAAQLCEVCAPTDLLVVGSRGRSPFTGLLLGSVSRACLSHAPCSVVVVRSSTEASREPAEQHGTVLVGIDASDAARRALQVAAAEAGLRGAALRVLHAVEWEHLGAELMVPTTRQLLSWGQDLVTGELARAGVDARAVVAHGNAGDLLVGRSADADLLVLGSRGHNPLAALSLGSTSDFCARHAHCPVLVVR